MGLQIAHFPGVWTLEAFDFSLQPSVDECLIQELATANFLAHGEAVLMFGSPGVGKTHLAIGLGRKVVERGHTVRFTTATALLSVLAKAESEDVLQEKLTEFAKPNLLIIDELGYLPFKRRAAHRFFPRLNSSAGTCGDLTEPFRFARISKQVTRNGSKSVGLSGHLGTY